MARRSVVFSESMPRPFVGVRNLPLISASKPLAGLLMGRFIASHFDSKRIHFDKHYLLLYERYHTIFLDLGRGISHACNFE